MAGTRGDLLKRLRSIGPLFVALTIHVFRTVDTLTMAMMARGADRTQRTVRRPLRLMTRDWVVLVVGVLIVVEWLLMRWFADYVITYKITN